MFHYLKNERVKLYLTYPFFILFIVLFLHSRAFSLDFSLSLDPYLYSSWLFNYQYGFMKRGLVGETLSFLNISRDYNHVRLIAIFILLSLYYLLYILIIKTLINLKLKNNEVLTYACCFFFCSFTLSQFILEMSRFDQIFQILVILFLILLLKKANIYLCSCYIFIAIPLITLIHEAGIIIFIPTLLLLYYLQYKQVIPIFLFSIYAFISIILISYFGKINADQLQLLVENYQTYRGYNEFAFRTTSLSLYDNLIMNYHSFIDNKMLVPLTLCLTIIAPVIFFVIKSIPQKKYLWLFIFSMSPLALSVIAFDYFRWISLFLFNSIILLIYLINSNIIQSTQLLYNLNKYKKKILLYSLLSLFLGPLGVVNLYPHIHVNNNGGLSTKNLPIEIHQKLNFLH
ncbi:MULTISPECIES: sel1 repeat family protein [unclassified Acinetobacter]|uniref:sel1 repeat family protein n=1 Tax=unclassified Acinetobacter TaxID=196816 RepID=UPI0029349807|nr:MULTISPECIES: sel1 repeat family protein [unclassified Acinetobacter]WOE31300.1 sel1 repeat family protein [Acinetobacter sp. SAAs470]WOE39496.1 sel1 repeat family protein [Acinetobacter sp. SAAs474]